MSFLDRLRSLRATPQALWLLFVGTYRAGCLDLYLFVEGKDDLSFYQPHLRRKWESRGKVHAFNCNGKDTVISLMRRVKQSLDVEWRALFFIDKDVDDYCGQQPHIDPYLFETEWYSIENYITTPLALSVIWTDLLYLPATDARLTQLLTDFQTAYSVFSQVMQQVMGWVIHLRRSGYNVILNDVSMAVMVYIDEEMLSSLKAGWAEHILAASNTPVAQFDPAATALVADELNAHHPKTYIRGKFDLWFFVAFLRRVFTAVTERVAGEPRTIPQVQISTANAIDIISPRLSPPDSLIGFLNRVLPAGH